MTEGRKHSSPHLEVIKGGDDGGARKRRGEMPQLTALDAASARRAVLEADALRGRINDLVAVAAERVEEAAELHMQTVAIASHAGRLSREHIARVATLVFALVIFTMVANTLYTRRHTQTVVAEEAPTLVKGVVAEAFSNANLRIAATEAEQIRQRQESADTRRAVVDMGREMAKLAKRVRARERRQGVKTPMDEEFLPVPIGSADAAANSSACSSLEGVGARDASGWWQLTCREDDGVVRPMRCRNRILGQYSNCYLLE